MLLEGEICVLSQSVIICCRKVKMSAVGEGELCAGGDRKVCAVGKGSRLF